MKLLLVVTVLLGLTTGCDQDNASMGVDASSRGGVDANAEAATAATEEGAALAATVRRNVRAVLRQGSLIVTSGALGSAITVSQPSAGQITLTGVDTKINGRLAPATFSVTKDVRFTLGAGADDVTIDAAGGMSLPGNLIFQGGAGPNALRTIAIAEGPGLSVTGNVSLSNGGQHAEIDMTKVSVGGNLELIGRGQLTIVTLDAAKILGNMTINGLGKGTLLTRLSALDVRGSAQIVSAGIRAGTAFDAPVSFGPDGEVSVIGPRSRIAGSLTIRHAARATCTTKVAAADIGGNLSISGCSGTANFNSIMISATIKGATLLTAASPQDSISLGDATFHGPVQIVTSRANATLSIGSQAVHTEFELVAENRIVNGKQVVVYIPVFRSVVVAGGPVTFDSVVTSTFGPGADKLNLALSSRVRFNENASFDGGAGENVATLSNRNLSKKPSLVNFTVVRPD